MNFFKFYLFNQIELGQCGNIKTNKKKTHGERTAPMDGNVGNGSRQCWARGADPDPDPDPQRGGYQAHRHRRASSCNRDESNQPAYDPWLQSNSTNSIVDYPDIIPALHIAVVIIIIVIIIFFFFLLWVYNVTSSMCGGHDNSQVGKFFFNLKNETFFMLASNFLRNFNLETEILTWKPKFWP